jgi:hypothetical protein
MAVAERAKVEARIVVKVEVVMKEAGLEVVNGVAARVVAKGGGDGGGGDGG